MTSRQSFTTTDKKPPKSRVHIVGQGAFGVALKQCFHKPNVYVRRPFECAQEHAHIYSMAQFYQEASCFDAHDMVIVAISIRDIVAFAKSLPPHAQGVWMMTSKGLDANANMVVTEVLRTRMPQAAIGFLSGPHLSAHLTQDINIFNVATMPHHVESIKTLCAQTLLREGIRWYVHDDLAAAQVVAFYKNIAALAMGFVRRYTQNPNTLGIVFERALKDMQYLYSIRYQIVGGGVSMLPSETLLELNGLDAIALMPGLLADLWATTSGNDSRHYKAGLGTLSFEQCEASSTLSALHRYHQSHLHCLILAQSMIDVFITNAQADDAYHQLQRNLII